jgi:hypothetical protein
MNGSSHQYTAEFLGSLIFTIRKQRVILDADLARVYGVPTKRLNEQVRRNADRFPPDFLIQLTPSEAKEVQASRSQFATLKRGKNIKYLPCAFTEHGAIMAANVLNSQEAIRMSVFVVRAFIKMREALIGRSELERRLLQIENVLLEHDESIRKLYEAIRPLLLPPPEPQRKKIGFEAKEPRTRYRTPMASSR